jgi:small-conductance mechanosensitive channel
MSDRGLYLYLRANCRIGGLRSSLDDSVAPSVETKTCCVHWLAAGIILFLLLLHPGAAFTAGLGVVTNASDTSAAPQAIETKGLSPAEIRELLSRLTDDNVRALLIAELDRSSKEHEAAPEASGWITSARHYGPRIRESIALMWMSLGDLPMIPMRVWAIATQEDPHNSALGLLTTILGVLLAGGFAEWVFRRAIVTIDRKTDQPRGQSWAGKLGLVMLGMVIDLFALATFALGAALAALLFLGESEQADSLFGALLGIIAGIRLVSILARMLLSPSSEPLRLLPLGDADSARIFKTVLVLAAIIIAGQHFTVLLQHYGFEPGVVGLTRFTWSLLFVALVSIVLLRAQGIMSALVLGESHPGREVSRLRVNLAENCHVLAVAYVAGVWLLATGVRLATGRSMLMPALLTLALLVIIPVAEAGLNRLAARLFDDPQPQDGESPQAPKGYKEVALRNFRMMFYLLLIGAFTQVWGLDLQWLATAMVGGRIAGSLFEIVLSGVLMYALWSLVGAAVARHAPANDPSAQGSGDTEAGGAGATRLQTLLPLFQKFLFITLAVFFIMLMLSSIGVDIGPLLAGAGMIGIAIGFGAQALVRDIVSGVFFLLDDAFRMGEYIEMGDIRGSVEKVSIRSMQLRHHNGPLHTIPFGEIKQLTNYSRDWHIMKFELRLPFETDIDKVRKIIKSVGMEMLEDEVFSAMMLGPLKSQGVNRMDDSALIIRCKVPCIPGQQFMVRREAFTRIQKVFEEKGIKFAPRRVIVETTSPEPVVAAAAAALESPTEPGSGSAGDKP